MEFTMARPADRFVKKLSDSQKSKLTGIWRTGGSHRLRSRAHALLLSDEKWTVADIAQVFQVTGQTVYSWLDRWESNEDLEDAPRSGAPPKLNAVQAKAALEELAKQPHNPQGAIDNIEMRTGKQISLDILRRLARKGGLAWKRMRGSLHDRRDDAAFNLAKTEIAEFSRMTSQSDFNLWFFDEASFSLTPSIPYAWQRIGETIEIPFQRGKSLSAIGFVDLDNNFFSYEIEGAVNSEVVIAVMDKFASHVKGTNVVIIDNAPVHHSEVFHERVPVWNAQGLHLYFLPPYSPELNLIEIVWRQIKHHWLPLRAFRSIENLWEELGCVLAGIGKEHRLSFPSLQFP
jgi:transposase